MSEPRPRTHLAGHRGLVGSAILAALRRAGFDDLLLRGSHELDLRDQTAVEAFYAEHRPEWVFVAAARVGGILDNSSRPADFIRDNLQIQTNLIDSAWRHGARKLLFLGSSCIYPRECPQPIREEYLMTGPLEPTNSAYAVAKIAGIEMCRSYRAQHGFDAISVMPTNLYGTRDNFDLERSHVLPALIRKFQLGRLVLEGNLEAVAADEARHGRIPDDVLDGLGLERLDGGFRRRTGHAPRIVLWGTGSARREFLHAEDLGEACLFLMRHYSDPMPINVGHGRDISIRELAELVRELVGFEGEIVWDDSKPDGTPRKLLDTSRLERLGWQPRIGLREGIERVIADYRNGTPA